MATPLPGQHGIDPDPALAAPPVPLPKEPRAVQVRVFAHEVFERDPENRVATESMSEFLLDLCRPLLGPRCLCGHEPKGCEASTIAGPT
jgi:hypothetical protein